MGQLYGEAEERVKIGENKKAGEQNCTLGGKLYPVTAGLYYLYPVYLCSGSQSLLLQFI